MRSLFVTSTTRQHRFAIPTMLSITDYMAISCREYCDYTSPFTHHRRDLTSDDYTGPTYNIDIDIDIHAYIIPTKRLQLLSRLLNIRSFGLINDFLSTIVWEGYRGYENRGFSCWLVFGLDLLYIFVSNGCLVLDLGLLGRLHYCHGRIWLGWGYGTL
jgi:hypothetical protein